MSFLMQLHGLQTTMIYADVAVASKKKPLMPSVLDLDDSRVEYAKINHKLKEKIMKLQALPEIENGTSRTIDT